MRNVIVAAAMSMAFAGAAFAQGSTKPMNSEKTSPGTVGAMSNAPTDGVATNPQQIKKDTGSATKQAPGTVGAAPGADAASSKPNH